MCFAHGDPLERLSPAQELAIDLADLLQDLAGSMVVGQQRGGLGVRLLRHVIHLWAQARRYQTALSISFGGQTERVQGELVSGNFFQALGVKPFIGRVLSPEEDDRVYKGHPVVVLSHEYWTARFAADPNVIGQKIVVDNYPMTIVGVSAAGFNGLDPSVAPQIRLPIHPL